MKVCASLSHTLQNLIQCLSPAVTFQRNSKKSSLASDPTHSLVTAAFSAQNGALNHMGTQEPMSTLPSRASELLSHLPRNGEQCVMHHDSSNHTRNTLPPRKGHQTLDRTNSSCSGEQREVAMECHTGIIRGK